jgi:hypothetical protein
MGKTVQESVPATGEVRRRTAYPSLCALLTKMVMLAFGNRLTDLLSGYRMFFASFHRELPCLDSSLRVILSFLAFTSGLTPARYNSIRREGVR